jgi:hypothetical protein
VPLSKRITRWIWADRNPLRRPIDRFESVVRILLVLAFLVGAPLLGPATHHLADVAGVAQVRREVSWRQVDAVLQRPSPRQFYGYGSLATFACLPLARTVWSQQTCGRTGRLAILAGSKVRVWVDLTVASRTGTR